MPKSSIFIKCNTLYNIKEIGILKINNFETYCILNYIRTNLFNHSNFRNTLCLVSNRKQFFYGCFAVALRERPERQDIVKNKVEVKSIKLFVCCQREVTNAFCRAKRPPAV